MMDTTTIQISREQKAQLDELKRVDGESYKSVIGLLIAHYNNRDEQLEADETADYGEFIETMQSIQSSAQTAEERTGQIQRQLEEMGQR